MSRYVHRIGWYKDALEAIEKLVTEKRFITVDDLRAELKGLQPKHHNDYGAVFNAAAYQEQLIEATRRVVRSRHAPAKGRMVQVWQSTIWKGFSGEQEDLESYIVQAQGGQQETLL